MTIIFELTSPFYFFLFILLFARYTKQFYMERLFLCVPLLWILFLFCIYLCNYSNCTCVYVWIEKKLITPKSLNMLFGNRGKDKHKHCERKWQRWIGNIFLKWHLRSVLTSSFLWSFTNNYTVSYMLCYTNLCYACFVFVFFCKIHCDIEWIT